MKTVTEINEIIQSLSENEDRHQDLWLHYLNSNQIHSLCEKPKIEDNNDPIIRHAMWRLLKQPPSDSLLQVIDNLSDFERSIVYMLMLGLTPKEICTYKGINEVRIRQAICAIRYNSSWRKYYGENLPSEE